MVFGLLVALETVLYIVRLTSQKGPQFDQFIFVDENFKIMYDSAERFAIKLMSTPFVGLMELKWMP